MLYRENGVTYNVRYEHYPDTGDGTPDTIDIERVTRDGIDVPDSVIAPMCFRIARAARREIAERYGGPPPRPLPRGALIEVEFRREGDG